LVQRKRERDKRLALMELEYILGEGGEKSERERESTYFFLSFLLYLFKDEG
jgi:hypothetical protein